MADRTRVREGLKKVWGWSDEDIKKYYDFDANRGKQTKVDYITSEKDLKKFVVQAGPSLTYGADAKSFDTTNMVSKASGPGFAIFVMDGQGNIYAGQHRVGLFHHSSFLAGRAVAAAGEMQVIDGALKMITAKSGHYMPTPENTLQPIKQLAAMNVPMKDVDVKLWMSSGGGRPDTAIVDAEDFLKNGTNATVKAKVGTFE
jgi:hypothetical protein